MKIVAIDFETANSKPDSACSLGYCVYEDGVLTASDVFLIRPPEGSRYFEFTYIHHLTYEDVKDVSEFDHHYPFLKELFDGALLCAHNARFDIGVLNAMCDAYHLPHFHNHYLDTVRLAKRVWPALANHRLNTVSEYLQVELDHHEAQSDAMACLMIVLKAMETYEIFDIERLMHSLYLKIYYNY